MFYKMSVQNSNWIWLNSSPQNAEERAKIFVTLIENEGHDTADKLNNRIDVFLYKTVF